MPYAVQNKHGDELNRLYAEDLPVHEWYRFVLSFPPHLVRDYLDRFDLSSHQRVLDPFCGTGTTLVECKKRGISSIGVEANPVVRFAATTKTDWQVDPDRLLSHACKAATAAEAILETEGLSEEILFQPLRNGNKARLRQLEPELARLLIRNSISPLPLHKTLVLLDVLASMQEDHFAAHERLALAKQLVHGISNLRFGPEVGVGKAKEDAPVVSSWLSGVRAMAHDLRQVQPRRRVPSQVIQGDARLLDTVIEPCSVDAVITSPPYPNEKDYSRTTRLEAVLLGFLTSREDLRRQKQSFLRSNTRAVYKSDEDDAWIEGVQTVQQLAEAIEMRRIALNKTSGFERLYARVVKLYFGGMARHLEQLKAVLRPGARLAYVVGDQASFFRIIIKTGGILAEIAERRGYQVVGIDLFRSRFSTATQSYLDEEVVLLQWRPHEISVTGMDMTDEPDETSYSERSAFEEKSLRYEKIIQHIFESNYTDQADVVPFSRTAIVEAASLLGVSLPKNLGDVVYSFKYRTALPESIREKAPPGKEWVIVNKGRARYAFVAKAMSRIQPDRSLIVIKIPDSTPGMVARYALSDEQALLARLRYNRMLDIFTGVTCYSLQNHLRTTVKGIGQVETDELYAGVDRKGAHYILPVQAKGGADALSVVQIEQDMALCREKFPGLVCRSIAAQFIGRDLIALFELDLQEGEVRKVAEKHYRLVPPDELTPEELQRYRNRVE